MAFATSISITAYMICGLYLVIGFLCYRMMRNRNYMLLLLWPIMIYFGGPVLTGMFADQPVLSRYVFPEHILGETLLMFIYFLTLLLADKLFGISRIIAAVMSNPTIRTLSDSPAFLPTYMLVSVLTVALQAKLLHDFGSVFTGSYVLAGVDEGLIPFWGFLAGLYELVFLLFVLFILSTDHGFKLRFLVIAIYSLTAILRVAGGTRLILIKEIAFVIILFYMQGRIKARHVITVLSIALVAGSAIGLLRSKDVGSDVLALGPLFGLVMESSLDALTLNIAYHLQETGYIAHHADTFHTLQFIFFSSIPKFARFSISPAALDALSPYNAALNFGYDAYAPVGGMSGFATLCYLSSYPACATFILSMGIGIVFRYYPIGNFKRIFILVFLLNAIHFWRDPTEMAVKQVTQDVFCALLLLGCSSLRLTTRGERKGDGCLTPSERFEAQRLPSEKHR